MRGSPGRVWTIRIKMGKFRLHKIQKMHLYCHSMQGWRIRAFFVTPPSGPHWANTGYDKGGMLLLAASCFVIAHQLKESMTHDRRILSGPLKALPFNRRMKKPGKREYTWAWEPITCHPCKGIVRHVNYRNFALDCHYNIYSSAGEESHWVI